MHGAFSIDATGVWPTYRGRKRGAGTSPVTPSGIVESMSDDAFYRPNFRPPPRAPRPGEPIWSLHKDGSTWSAEVRDHGTGVGIEAQILRDGDLVIGPRFDLRELAMRWAEQKRHAIERGVRDQLFGG